MYCNEMSVYRMIVFKSFVLVQTLHLSIDLASFLIIEIIQKKKNSKASRKNLTPSALKTENVFFFKSFEKKTQNLKCLILLPNHLQFLHKNQNKNVTIFKTDYTNTKIVNRQLLWQRRIIPEQATVRLQSVQLTLTREVSLHPSHSEPDPQWAEPSQYVYRKEPSNGEGQVVMALVSDPYKR